MSQIRQKIGKQAKNGANAKSGGKCLRAVGNAVQRALGQKQSAIGVQHAKDSAGFFTKRGFNLIPKPNQGQYQNGDLVIMQGSAKHPSGHAQIYYENKWYSDFAQNRFFPYSDGSQPNYQVYRYKSNE